MNDDITTALKVVAALGAASALIWLGVVMVKAARRGGGGIRAIGAGLMMLGSWVTIRDPRNDTVAEVKDSRVRKDGYSGDPLEPEDRS